MAAKKIEEEEAGGGFKFRYVLYIVLILLLLMAVFSHSPEDLAVLDGGNDGAIKNWVGPLGAWLAKILFLAFGLAVGPVALLVAIAALRPFLPFPTHRRGYSGALLAMIIGLTMLFAMWPEKFVSITDSLGFGRLSAPVSALSGGVLGQQLAAPEGDGLQAGIVRRYIGTVGTATVAIVFFLSGAVFVWLADWRSVFAHLLMVRTETSTKKYKYDREEEDSPVRPAKDESGKEIESQEEEAESSLAILRKAREAAAAKDEELAKEEKPLEEPPSKPLPLMPKKAAEPEAAAAKPKSAKSAQKGPVEYTLPPISLLEKGKESKSSDNPEFVEVAKRRLEATLESFAIDGKVTGIITGPRVTRFEVSLAPGIKVEKVSSIANNIAMELEAESIRILAPIPGKNTVGVEVPNGSPAAVFMRSQMETDAWKNSSAQIPVVLGKDVAGKPIILDLARAPHLLIAGSTGSGKSVCMNTLIMSLLFKFSPNDLRLIMVDPKIVELEVYSTLPHLITPVVNEAKKVPLALRWGVNEMEKRYRMMAKVKTKDLAGFNSRPMPKEPVLDDAGNPIPASMPLLLLIIDELADIMMTDAKVDVEQSICRIAQKGRAAGIHIVIATQRPDVKIITGVIKANLPTRIAFRVTSQVDSRVILDHAGAEKLLGKGDMLFVPPGSANEERIQGAMVPDSDIKKVVEFVSAQVEQDFDEKVVSAAEGAEDEEGTGDGERDEVAEFKVEDEAIRAMLAKYSRPGDDDNTRRSLEILFTEKKISTSYLQRRLGIGYNKAAEIMDEFEHRELVSAPLPGGTKRDILVFDDVEKGA